MGGFACYALCITDGAAAFGSPAGRASLGVEWDGSRCSSFAPRMGREPPCLLEGKVLQRSRSEKVKHGLKHVRLQLLSGLSIINKAEQYKRTDDVHPERSNTTKCHHPQPYLQVKKNNGVFLLRGDLWDKPLLEGRSCLARCSCLQRMHRKVER